MVFRTILFDIDGVMLSEERYFDASALTIFELLFSPQYFQLPVGSLPDFHPQFAEPEIRAIRREVFADDVVLSAMKQRGVNANWDMVYLQTTFQVTEILKLWLEQVGDETVRETLLGAPSQSWTRDTVAYFGQSWRAQGLNPQVDFFRFAKFAAQCQSKEELFTKLEHAVSTLVGHIHPGYTDVKKLWHLGQETFQEWYLGDDYVSVTHQSGKRGFLMDEVPLLDPRQFSAVLQEIQDKGIELGIATGRPRTETQVPLQHFGWLRHFPGQRISTASDVLAAELRYPEQRPLAKPNPFSYLRSFLATTDARTVLDYPLPIPEKDGRHTLIVGDSVADLLAARAMGCQFAAVLTGLEGEQARAQFENLGSDFIWNNALGVLEVVH